MIKKIITITFALGAFVASAQTIDLREYLPHGSVQTLYKADGTPHSRYTIEDNNPSFVSLYGALFNQGKAGVVSFLKKEYKINGSWCPVTYAVLLKGTDKSVTEVGDWGIANCTTGKASGYKTFNGQNSGLGWSDVGGLILNKPTNGEFEVYDQQVSNGTYSPIGYQAYARAGLVEVLPTFTPAHDGTSAMWVIAGGQTYTNVIKHVMYHGVKKGNSTTPIRCINAYLGANGEHYQSYKNYNSYAMVLWLAKGVGVVQEKLLFTEDGAYWNVQNCTGYPFNRPFAPVSQQ